MSKLVLTALGPDRTGLVSALAAAVADAGGNWLESWLGRLAGKFAGIVLVDIPAGSVPALAAAAERLGADGVLTVTVSEVEDAPRPAGSPLHVYVLGNDRPGIVREVSGALASLGVTIEELRTSTRPAPMADYLLFEADADVLVPAGITADAVREAVEALAHDIVVDLDEPSED